jgi:tRNA A37 N6-isopentenylltransferase MiaA
MTRQLHLFIGPTGVGKTARSVDFALRYRCPVIGLDRVQCHPELAIGSARPMTAELRGTVRVTLDERPVTAGTPDAPDLVDRLPATLDRLRARGIGAVVLEGGSLSVLRELAGRTDWARGASVQVTCLVEKDPARYRQALARRVARMLGYGHQGPTLLDEVRLLYPDPVVRPVLRDMLGYREVIDGCLRNGLDPVCLTGSVARAWRHEFYHPIRQCHLAYSGQQHRELPALAAALAGNGCEVIWCDR